MSLAKRVSEGVPAPVVSLNFPIVGSADDESRAFGSESESLLDVGGSVKSTSGSVNGVDCSAQISPQAGHGEPATPGNSYPQVGHWELELIITGRRLIGQQFRNCAVGMGNPHFDATHTPKGSLLQEGRRNQEKNGRQHTPGCNAATTKAWRLESRLNRWNCVGENRRWRTDRLSRSLLSDGDAASRPNGDAFREYNLQAANSDVFAITPNTILNHSERTGNMLPGVKQFDLSGKSAVITGGSKGLGFAMAAGLASAGADVFLVSRNGAQAAEAAREIAADFGRVAVGFEADVSSVEQVDAMAAAALEQFGKVDILINNAGVNVRGPIDELTYEEFRHVQQINVDGVWLCSKAFTPAMKHAKSGKIINLSSTLGLVGLANRTPYATSKGAVAQMTRALALELAPFHINVNAICPGPFLTEMNVPIAETEEGKEFIVGATALKRWGRLEEIQGAAIFLASDAASYLVGSMMVVDGGWTAR